MAQKKKNIDIFTRHNHQVIIPFFKERHRLLTTQKERKLLYPFTNSVIGEGNNRNCIRRQEGQRGERMLHVCIYL